MKFKQLFAHFREMKHFFIATAMVFAIGIFVGYEYSANFADYLQGGLEKLKPINDFVNTKDNPQLWLFIIIFLNNASIAIMVIFLGMIFGLLPLFMLVSNGMILGYALSLNTTGSTGLLVLKGILPHGIFEISAILIACAYGLKLGTLMMKLCLHVLIRRVGATARPEFIRIFKLLLPLITFIVILLLIAATVESTLSYWLMKV
ncbi:stage II sporulation protein M [Paenibacillus sp. GP183]|uniref:stage II sporulation protein M n=1 Tax=Paenibacillus sp. GP183 TaxID=1882751 RepID=UPI00089B1247|nr:stage II sporulation protein M [Paenibacillus sp. GP183]SEC19018.1 stage II sporulation protein M [Paenibacillus sp. GP183]